MIYGIPTPILGLCIMAGVIPGLNLSMGLFVLGLGAVVDWFAWWKIAGVNHWNAPEFQRRLANWQAESQCSRCGAVGIPS